VLSDQRFDQPTIYVGRHEACQVRLTGDDQRVSDRHVMIFREADRWFVEPLHDRYRVTNLNGHLLQGKQLVDEGDQLQIGAFDVQVFVDHVGEDQDRAIPLQIIAKSFQELEENEHLENEKVGIPIYAVTKTRSDVFTLPHQRVEYVCSFGLQTIEFEDVRPLMNMVLDTLLEHFDASVVWIGLRTDSEGQLNLAEGRNFHGQAVDAPALARQYAYGVVECGRHVLIPVLEDRPEQSAMAAPLISPDGVLGMIHLESIAGKPRYNETDLDCLTYLCCQTAMVIDKVLRTQTRRLKDVLDAEEALARRVQASVAPWQLPQWPGLQVAVLAEPGGSKTTDFYDVTPTGGQGQAVILIGQSASDTHVAMTIAEICAAFRIGAVHRDAPAVLMRQLNWLLTSKTGEHRWVNAAVAAIDPNNGEFELCPAGEIYASIIEDAGGVQRLRCEGNPPLGKVRKVKFESIQGRLSEGQTLVLCSYSIFRVRNSQGQTFGEDSVLMTLQDAFGQAPGEMLRDLADDMVAFTGGRKCDRDVTIILARKREPGG